MNAALHKATMNQARLQHKTQTFPNSTNWENFRQQRNLVTKIKRKSIRIYFDERCPDNGSSYPKTFWDTVHPFFSDKGLKSSDNIQLLEGDTLLAKPTDTANVINKFFTNITSTIREHVSEATLELDDEEFISLSYDKYKDHPSVKIIAENHQLP